MTQDQDSFRTTATPPGSSQTGEPRRPDPDTPFTDKARAFAHDAVDSASNRAEDVERKARAEARRAAHKVEEGEERARQQIDQTMASVEKFVRERPVAGVGMAFVAGMVAAILLRR